MFLVMDENEKLIEKNAGTTDLSALIKGPFDQGRDVLLTVSHGLSVDQVKAVVEAAEAKLREIAPNAQMMAEIVPRIGGAFPAWNKAQTLVLYAMMWEAARSNIDLEAALLSSGPSQTDAMKEYENVTARLAAVIRESIGSV